MPPTPSPLPARLALARTLLLAIPVCAALAGCAPTAPRLSPDAPARAEANKAVAQAFIDAFGRRDWTAMDRLVTPGFQHHNTYAPTPMAWPAYRAGLQAIVGVMPDYRHEVQDLFAAEGDRVVVRLVGRGTHQASFYDEVPTGRPIRIPLVLVVRLEDGRVAEDWEVVDLNGAWSVAGFLTLPQ